MLSTDQPSECPSMSVWPLWNLWPRLVNWPPFLLLLLSILKLLLKEGFELQGYCDLDLWLINSKLIQVICYLPTSILNLKILCQSVIMLLIRQNFNLQCHCDLDLWPRYIKIIRGHLPVMTNLHTKLEHHRSMCSQVNDQTKFWPSMLLWLWPRNIKINRIIQ